MIIYRDLKPENAAVSDLSLLHHAIALLCSRGAFLPGVVVFWFPQGRKANVQGGLLDFMMNFVTLGAGSAYPPMIEAGNVEIPIWWNIIGKSRTGHFPALDRGPPRVSTVGGRAWDLEKQCPWGSTGQLWLHQADWFWLCCASQQRSGRPGEEDLVLDHPDHRCWYMFGNVSKAIINHPHHHHKLVV